MPKLEGEEKFGSAFSSPGGAAALLFKTMHNKFPGAEWDPKVPSVEAKGFADWMDAQFEQLPAAAQQLARPYRDGIGKQLLKIDTSPNVALWEAQASKIAQNFTGLVDGIGNSAAGPQWVRFQNASASVLLRVSALMEDGG